MKQDGAPKKPKTTKKRVSDKPKTKVKTETSKKAKVSTSTSASARQAIRCKIQCCSRTASRRSGCR